MKSKMLGALAGMAVGLMAIAGAGSASAREVAGWTMEFDGKGACTMTSEYNAGQGFKAAVSIGIIEDGMGLVFVSERWDMSEGETARVKMTIDRSFEQWVTAQAKDKQTVMILFNYSGELLDAIARGRKIGINDGKEAWDFTLHGTSQAVPELIKCAKRYIW